MRGPQECVHQNSAARCTDLLHGRRFRRRSSACARRATSTLERGPSSPRATHDGRAGTCRQRDSCQIVSWGGGHARTGLVLGRGFALAGQLAHGRASVRLAACALRDRCASRSSARSPTIQCQQPNETGGSIPTPIRIRSRPTVSHCSCCCAVACRMPTRNSSCSSRGSSWRAAQRSVRCTRDSLSASVGQGQ